MRPHRTLLFATGGTGGHIYPAIAIAKEATERGYDSIFLGQEGGMEARIVPFEGFAFYGVPAGKWDRQRPNPLQAFRALSGFQKAVITVRRLKPDLVIGFGGFASFPGLAAAKLLDIPYILHEGNAHPGKVIRLFEGGAKRIAVSKTAAPAFKRDDLELTGFPVREKRISKVEARADLGLPLEGTLTLVMGGSQGSLILNETVPEAFKNLEAETAVLHSTGPKWLESVTAATYTFPNYFPLDFVDATLAWSAADLAITRSGIGTLSEAAFHEVPSIMIPLPSAAENHQLRNAQAVADQGAGWVLEEKNSATLATLWQRALQDETRQKAARAAARLSPKGAASAVVNLIDELLAPPALEQTWQESV